ncbi:fatty acid desaturase family protein [uncultured Aquabacterium sp.]|uniref:fatty acid desaturase family protein n=1 Tax=Aquabacterium sp. TaxID=1872578 RepID=UPI0025DECD4B|nr:fatty acid desaturase family protein [uncultured Aquabacterium sp.]
METPLHLPRPPVRTGSSDYDLLHGAGNHAASAGLVNANWYRCAVPRPVMKELMQRNDARALRDTALWYALIIASGLLAWSALDTAWAVPAFLLYGTLYCGPADSRWHEASHGTAFKTRWMNEVLYQLACFQVMRRPTVWRWTHARHHTDTLVTGRDPEIAVPVPVNVFMQLIGFFGLIHAPREIWRVLVNATGHISAHDKSYIPEMEWPKVVREARVWVLIYTALVAGCVAAGTWVPLLFIGLPSIYGAWLYSFFGLTQHAALPENVLDHRANCRTVYMNPVFRFLYWNMNYHVEHHMFPMVPFHALPRLHEVIAADCPPAYPSTAAAYAEILPNLLKQARDPGHYVRRPIPGATPASSPERAPLSPRTA